VSYAKHHCDAVAFERDSIDLLIAMRELLKSKREGDGADDAEQHFNLMLRH